MSNPQTLPASGNATSSPASADGPSPPALPAGQTTANSGPAPRRASRSASPAKAKPKPTIGTCGPTCFASSVPDGPLSSWENRLRQRLASIGSTECMLTWKASATPAGRSLSRLVPSTRPTDGTACGLWQTPVADDAVNRVRGKWNSRGEPKLSGQVMALWPTPVANDDNKSPEAHMAMKARMKGGPRNCITSLQVMSKAIGREHDGSSATTEKPGALNPAFVCWLMGFPPEWDACAPTETPSSRRSRLK